MAVALATVTGWKAAASEAARLKAEETARLAAEAANAAAKAEAERIAGLESRIAAGMKSGLLEPHAEGPRRVYAASCKSIEALDGFLAALGGAPLVPATPEQEPESAAAPILVDEKNINLSAAETALAAKMGISAAEMKKNKLRLMQRNAQRAARAGE
jgi:hypothetical protein